MVARHFIDILDMFLFKGITDWHMQVGCKPFPLQRSVDEIEKIT